MLAARYISVCYIPRMDVFEIRRKNLLKLVAEAGSQAAFSRLTDIAPAYINQLLRTEGDTRNIGERAARKIEKKAMKPSGWLDAPANAKELPASADNEGEQPALGREEQELVSLFGHLDDDNRKLLVEFAELLAFRKSTSLKKATHSRESKKIPTKRSAQTR